MKHGTILFILLSFSPSVFPQEVATSPPPLREQARIQQEWLNARVERVLPKLMRENNIRMWIVPMREYNEDP
ncbi:MAG: Xaa-Pro aminopeptidase, partial [Bacteroidota bacterium]